MSSAGRGTIKLGTTHKLLLQWVFFDFSWNGAYNQFELSFLFGTHKMSTYHILIGAPMK